MSAVSGVYDQQFYDSLSAGVSESAAVVVPIVMEAVRPASVLDVGCGNGIWLSEFLRCGVERVQGVDGDYVDQDKLAIPRAFFKAKDLTNGVVDFGRFDLAMCLEVAEHLPATSSAALVHSLVNAAEVVLFSAAVPGQAGTNHINLQWPIFWQNLFAVHGYQPVNLILPRIRDNRKVDWWYRQNLLLFASPSVLDLHPEWRALIPPRGEAALEWVYHHVAAREETFASVWKKFRRVCGLELARNWPRVHRLLVVLKK